MRRLAGLCRQASGPARPQRVGDCVSAFVYLKCAKECLVPALLVLHGLGAGRCTWILRHHLERHVAVPCEDKQPGGVLPVNLASAPLYSSQASRHAPISLPWTPSFPPQWLDCVMASIPTNKTTMPGDSIFFMSGSSCLVLKSNKSLTSTTLHNPRRLLIGLNV
jgi:hypothetical protein